MTSSDVPRALHFLARLELGKLNARRAVVDRLGARCGLPCDCLVVDRHADGEGARADKERKGGASLLINAASFPTTAFTAKRKKFANRHNHLRHKSQQLRTTTWFELYYNHDQTNSIIGLSLDRLPNFGILLP
jgi:hypothetical protein